MSALSSDELTGNTTYGDIQSGNRTVRILPVVKHGNGF
jgi:hypothetical protein